jgi:aspartate racemase
VAPRNDVEERVAAIWARTLRVKQVGVHDDFFEIGGNSLLAVRLLDEMEREFNVEIPLASFFRVDVTVAGLAAVVENVADRPASSGLMVDVHTRGANPIIFFVYPDEASLLSLRHLRKPVGADHRIVALVGDPDGRPFDRSQSVEGLALPMLEAIRTVQPSGPYRIIGYSFGGLLAYELASRLRECGDDVAWLGILDAAVPGGLWPRGPGAARGLPRLWRIVRRRDRGAREEVWFVADLVRHEFRALLVRLHVRPMQIGDWDIQGGNKMAKKYTCRPNDAPLDVFATGHADPEKVSSLGWDTVHRGPLRVHHVPGDHKSLVQEPYVSILAGELIRSLRTVPERAEVPTS